MQTRIRYKKSSDGTTLVSTKEVVCGMDVAVVYIVPSELSFQVEHVNGKLLASGTASSLAKVKKQAKDALVALGANFRDEVRPRNELVVGEPEAQEQTEA